MKVALCHHYSLTFHGGGERFLIDTAKQLRKMGHEAVIYALPFERRPVDLSKVLEGIEYHEGFIHSIRNVDVAYFIYAPLVHKLFRGEFPRIGALHAFVFLDELQHSDVRNMNHSTFVREFGLSRFISNQYFDRFERRRLSGFDAIHVINSEALGLFSNDKRVYYVPNWIDTSRFKCVEERNEKFTVLFTGRRAKGYSTFVGIADLLANEKIDFVSIGPDLESMGKVKYIGFITDMDKLISLYSKVHVLIYASKIDAFPLTLLEAASCEIPTIALPTRAIQGLNLPLFYAKSTNDYAKKVCELQNLWHNKNEDYVKLGKGMRKEAAKYDVKEVFPIFLEMLEEVAELSSE